MEADCHSIRLEHLERLLADPVEGLPAVLPRECRDFVQRGKRLRAHLLFASAPTNGAPSNPAMAVRAAAAIELVHAASLLHDDIVDDCTMRRGHPALHQAVGERTAILDGAVLVHLALTLISDLPAAARARIADTAQEVTRGQFLEIMRAFDRTLSPADRLTISGQKTASVFAVACELGAMLMGGTAAYCTRKRQFGFAFGMLFQIADDLADLLATGEELGRPPGSDFAQGVISLPVAFALESRVKEEVAAMIDGVRLAESLSLARFRTLLQLSGALHRTSEEAHRYARAAREQHDPDDSAAYSELTEALIDDTLGRILRYAVG